MDLKAEFNRTTDKLKAVLASYKIDGLSLN